MTMNYKPLLFISLYLLAGCATTEKESPYDYTLVDLHNGVTCKSLEIGPA